MGGQASKASELGSPNDMTTLCVGEVCLSEDDLKRLNTSLNTSLITPSSSDSSSGNALGNDFASRIEAVETWKQSVDPTVTNLDNWREGMNTLGHLRGWDPVAPTGCVGGQIHGHKCIVTMSSNDVRLACAAGDERVITHMGNNRLEGHCMRERPFPSLA
jgi:hypothetical protein